MARTILENAGNNLRRDVLLCPHQSERNTAVAQVQEQ